MNNIELGKFLAKLRQEKGITQEKLAEMLIIDKRKVSRWETGVSTPEFDMLIKLTKILDITLYELSIGHRIEDEKLRDKAKRYFKTITDLKKYTLRKKVISIISIIIGVLLGLSAIFTINNYGKVAIYSLYSVDDDFLFKGFYTQTQKYGIVSIANLINKENNINYITSNYKIKNYEIKDKNGKIIIQSTKNINYKLSTFNEIIEKNAKFKENGQFIFNMIYYDEDNNIKSFSFNFKVSKKYNNRLFN